MESEVRNRKNISNKTKRTALIPSSPKKAADCTTECSGDVDDDERVQRVSNDKPNVSDIKELSNETKSQNPVTAKNSENTNALADQRKFNVVIEFDLMAILMFSIAFCTRIYRLAEPNNIV